MGERGTAGEDGRPQPRRAFSRRAALTGGVTGAAALLLAPEAISDAVAPPIYYPEDFGAKGDGRTDDTAAIQACIDAAASSTRSGVVQLAARTYLVAGTPRHDRGGNAVLALPHSPDDQTCLVLQGSIGNGVVGRTEIVARASGQSYSAKLGAPSVIGGPTPEQLGRAGAFSKTWVAVRDLQIASPADPTVGGLDLSRHVNAEVRNVTVTTTNPGAATPTHGWTFGIRLPDGLNYGLVGADDAQVFGYYAGIVCNTAHTRIGRALAQHCVVGLGLQGSGTANGDDPHAMTIENLGTDACPFHIGGWTAADGLVALPADQPVRLNVSLWDIEDGPGPFATLTHLIDGNGAIFGHINYNRVRYNAGIQLGPLSSTSPTATLYELGASAGFQKLTTPPVSGTVHRNPTGRPVFVAAQFRLEPTPVGAADVKVEVSPDGRSFTQVADPSSPARGDRRQDAVTFMLPGGWRYRLTATRATLGTIEAVG